MAALLTGKTRDIIEALSLRPSTALELARLTGYHLTTVVKVVRGLEEKGEVERVKSAVHTHNGRRPDLWAISGSSSDYLPDGDENPEVFFARAKADGKRFIEALKQYEKLPKNRLLKEGVPITMHGLPSTGQSSMAMCAEMGEAE